MKKGVVSILVCCYNGVDYISTCFNSILAQTYKAIDVIFIDDGSDDGSFDVAQNYERAFALEGMNLICLKQTNQGVGYACANGLLHADGEFVSNFDIDDYLYPESIKQRVDFLNTHPEFAIVRTNGYKMSKDGKRTLFVTEEREKNNESIFEDLLLGYTNNWPGSYMVRQSALWDVYPDHNVPASRFGQNLQILMSVAWKNKSGFIDEPLMIYNYNPRSFTNHNTDFDSSYKRIIGFWDIRKDILLALNIDNPQMQEMLKLNYSRILMDLCITHNKREHFLEIYDSISAIRKPATIYRYYYNLYKGEKIKAIVFRVINWVQLRFKG